jgi:hypothetical protein
VYSAVGAAPRRDSAGAITGLKVKAARREGGRKGPPHPLTLTDSPTGGRPEAVIMIIMASKDMACVNVELRRPIDL